MYSTTVTSIEENNEDTAHNYFLFASKIDLPILKNYDFYSLSSFLFPPFTSMGTISLSGENYLNSFDNKNSSSIKDFTSVKDELRNNYYSFIRPVKLSEEDLIFSNTP